MDEGTTGLSPVTPWVLGSSGTSMGCRSVCPACRTPDGLFPRKQASRGWMEGSRPGCTLYRPLTPHSVEEENIVGNKSQPMFLFCSLHSNVLRLEHRAMPGGVLPIHPVRTVSPRAHAGRGPPTPLSRRSRSVAWQRSPCAGPSLPVRRCGCPCPAAYIEASTSSPGSLEASTTTRVPTAVLL